MLKRKLGKQFWKCQTIPIQEQRGYTSMTRKAIVKMATEWNNFNKNFL